MAVFKASYTGKDGKQRQTGKYYVEFRDHNDVVRRVPGFKGKRESEKLEQRLQSLVDHKRNNELPGRDLAKWLEDIEDKQRNRLVKFKLLDERRVHVGRDLEQHLADFQAKRTEKGTSEAQARLVVHRARRVFDAAGFTKLLDISKDKVETAAANLRKDTGMSAQTFNYHLAACKQFTSWCVGYDRLQADPLAVSLKKLGALNVKTDRRHERRALTVKEARALLEAAEGGPEIYGMTGKARAMLYRLALESGLRANELRGLEVSKLELTGKAPTVSVPASITKNGEDADLPLRPETAAMLKDHCKGKLPQAPVFTMPPKWDVVKMLRADLDAAGIPYRDDDGRVADFHALRHTFVTNLAEAGVYPKIAQTLARHSSITLTMDRYTHLRKDDERAALDALPSLDSPKQKRRKA